MNKIVQGLTVVDEPAPPSSTQHLATINKLVKSPGRRRRRIRFLGFSRMFPTICSWFRSLRIFGRIRLEQYPVARFEGIYQRFEGNVGPVGT